MLTSTAAAHTHRLDARIRALLPISLLPRFCLLSNGAVLVEQPMPLRDIVTGLAEVELPGHTKQLLDLR
ncbi:hypothetical protein [Streptomyces capitiformicae]|uniref:Uncharacterized protein n=1 Tax=Streptomyces capitiformicae TaxID=2014920 RepID=A0A919DGJ4_9ACTN|nr:hypothetical protein [Streptomyces capitiformicae]GHE45763.1 hypothetical protein GCM10017771_66300 [Streptomyces capitiformicae]